MVIDQWVPHKQHLQDDDHPQWEYQVIAKPIHQVPKEVLNSTSIGKEKYKL